MSTSAIKPVVHTITTMGLGGVPEEVPVVNFRDLSQEIRVWERRLQDAFRSKLGEDAGDDFFFYLIYNLMGDEYPQNNIELLQNLFTRYQTTLLAAIGNWVITLKKVIFGMDVFEGPSPLPIPEGPYAFWLMIEPYITEHWAGKFSHALLEEQKDVMRAEFRSEWIRTMRFAYLAQTREDQEAILADFQLLQEISVSFPMMAPAEVAQAAYPVIHRLFMPMLKLGFDWSDEAKVSLYDPSEDYDDGFDGHYDPY